MTLADRSLVRAAGWRRLWWWQPERRWAMFLVELFCFGIKQASACLFGGLMVALLLASWRWYPPDAPLAR